MSADAPPPYPGNEKGYGPPPPAAGYPPPGGYPPPQAGYPPPQPGYPPAQAGYPPPPQQGYPPAQGGPPAQNTTVVVTQPPVTLVQTFQAIPVRTCCPHCRAEIVTATRFENGTFSWVVCFILCIIGCVLGCCLIPFCVEGCQDVIHTCPNCHQHIARWSRM
ncbi:cell death-inducing p53-target protein 1 homolog [Aplysia californica]|uniref:Cell death-inducing p53-target protein 1 homolog n=1 Tax=Aplysia californica TaxID=6500 RepID=A0ABM0JMS9_APLCA|nr:cell death-inducing p53-target protein 1 homolog [Aplysia californica]